MIAHIRRVFVIGIFLVMPLLLHAQGAAPTPPLPDPCSENPNAKNADYTLSAANGTPIPVDTDKDFHYTLKNNHDVLIRLQDINPYSFTCAVTTRTTPVQETAVFGFLGLLGGVSNVGANTPDPAKGSDVQKVQPAAKSAAAPHAGVAAAPERLDCAALYKDNRSNQVNSLQIFRDRVNQALRDTQAHQYDVLFAFTRRVASLRSQSECSKIVSQANDTVTSPSFEIVSVTPPDSKDAKCELPRRSFSAAPGH